MTASEFHSSERVLTWGEFARVALSTCSSGAISAVFRHSFYVQFGPNVVCFGPVGIGKGPINVLVWMREEVEWLQLGLAPGQKAWLSGSVISVANGTRFDFVDADVWRPPRAPRFSFDTLRAGLKLLSESALRRSPGGLGALLVGLDARPGWSNWPNDPLFQSVRTPVRDIADWIRRALARTDQLPSLSIQNLIGLGPGLTPSGDDFICGLMVALHYLGFTDAARKVSEAVLPIALRETNIISAQLLRCAAAGQASSALFDVLDAVLTCSNLEEHIDVIGAIGHTSGWDSLAGAALVCAAILETERLTMTR
jgi:hypothetical protein